MHEMVPESMIVRVFEGMCSVDTGVTAPPSGGVSREQLVIFLADTLRGTAEERAPLVMSMAHKTNGTATTDQIREVQRYTFFCLLWILLRLLIWSQIACVSVQQILHSCL